MNGLTDFLINVTYRSAAVALLLLTTACASMYPKPMVHESSPELDAARADQLISSANAALRSGDENKALLEYVAALQFAPDSSDIRYRIAAIHERRGESDAALQAYEDVLKTDPQHAGALEGAGLSQLKNQQYAQAESYLQRALALDGQRWRTLNGLGVLADLRRDPAAASEHYQAALAIEQSQSMLHNNYGYSRYLAGDYQTALIYFERALAANPDNKTAWANLALVSVRLGDSMGSMVAFTEIMEPYRAHNNVGYLNYMNGDYEAARSHLEQAIALSPAYYTMAHQNLERLAVVNP